MANDILERYKELKDQVERLKGEKIQLDARKKALDEEKQRLLAEIQEKYGVKDTESLRVKLQSLKAEIERTVESLSKLLGS